MTTIYGMAASGNCWKAAQILRLTGRAFRWVEVDSNGGETRTPGFLARFPMGKVPVVELDDGTAIAESNAILAHFAEGTPWLPPPGLVRTRVFEWLFWEQYSHEPTIAVCRFHMRYRGEPAETRDPRKVAGGEAALDLMERRLVAAEWFAGDRFTIADVALFAYTQFADEVGFSLDTRPAVRVWLTRCMQALCLPRAT